MAVSESYISVIICPNVQLCCHDKSQVAWQVIPNSCHCVIMYNNLTIKSEHIINK